jgi:hypothetical protein
MIRKLFLSIFVISLVQANMYWRDEKYEAAHKKKHVRVRKEREN